MKDYPGVLTFCIENQTAYLGLGWGVDNLEREPNSKQSRTITLMVLQNTNSTEHECFEENVQIIIILQCKYVLHITKKQHR